MEAKGNKFDQLMDRLPDAFVAGNRDLARGLSRCRAGHYAEAVELLQDGMGPDAPAMAHLLLALLQRELSRMAESGRSLAKALALAPNDSLVLYHSGMHSFQQGDHAKAEAFFRRALEANPHSVELLNDLGVLRYTMGHPDDSELFIRRALDLDPGDASALANLGLLLAAKGDQQGVERVLEQLQARRDEGQGARLAQELRQLLDREGPLGEAQSATLLTSDVVGRIAPMDMILDFRQADGLGPLDLSVVIPVYNEKDSVPVLYDELHRVLSGLTAAYEIIFVNDGSVDGTAEALEAVSAADPKVRVIEFRRNYGQTAALSAGFKYCRGETVVTMDGDLQNDPADIPMLLAKLAEGYDLVNGWRRDRKDKALTRRLPSWVANRLINKLIEGTGVQLKDFGCTLKAYKKGIIKNIHLYGEMHRFIPVFAAWLGVEVAEVPVNHRPRIHGETKYGLSRIPRVIFDLIVVRFFSDYMTRPIQFFGKIARKVMVGGLAVIGGLWAAKALWDVPVRFDTLLILLALVLVSGLQIVILGLSGELLIRSYFEGQHKDHYVVKRILGG